MSAMLSANTTVLATPENNEYECYNVVVDPHESADGRDPGCRALLAIAHEKFRILPKDMKRLRARPDWVNGGFTNR